MHGVEKNNWIRSPYVIRQYVLRYIGVYTRVLLYIFYILTAYNNTRSFVKVYQDYIEAEGNPASCLL